MRGFNEPPLGLLDECGDLPDHKSFSRLWSRMSYPVCSVLQLTSSGTGYERSLPHDRVVVTGTPKESSSAWDELLGYLDPGTVCWP